MPDGRSRVNSVERTLGSRLFVPKNGETNFGPQILESLPKKLKQTHFLPKNFLAKTFSTLFVKGTRQMGLPILRVVGFHSHNPNGPQIWHEFYLHWPEWDRPARSQIE